MPEVNATVDYDPFASTELAQVTPSTAAQKELWMAARMGAAVSCAFNESISLHLTGAVNETNLRSAWQLLIDRHQALRGTFSPDDGRLCIAEEGKAPLTCEELSKLPAPLQQERLQVILAEEVETPFDLENGPLARARLLRLGPNESWFILTAHHIICDGWSMAVVLRDLALLYSSPGSDALPVAQSFDAYADWLAESEQVESHQRAGTYWRKRLQGDLPILQLPTDRPRPPVKSYRSERHDHPLAPELVAKLKKLGGSAGASFFTVLLAGYAVFLHRLTGQRDVAIGVPAAGQSASGLGSVVGHCVNLLPIRCQLDPAESFTGLVRQLRTEILDAYDHQQISFGELLPGLKVPRDPSRTPLVSTVFNLDQALGAKDLPFAGLEVSYQSNPRHFENFELFINASEGAGRVVLECQYNTELFDGGTVRAWLESFEALLNGTVEQPGETIAKLPMLSRAQQQRVLVDWNATQLDYPRTQTVAQLLNEQALRAPERPALTCGSDTISYGELDRRANRLAHLLVVQGIGRDKLVGLCMDRSLDMVVGLLAILKTGAGYVPLDPKYPRERLAFMAEDARVALILTQEKWRTLFPAEQVHALCYESETAALASLPDTPPSCTSQPNDSAYVIYTSGSTGTPKGVAVMHANVVNLFAAMRQTPGIGADDVLLAVTTLSFDIAVAEILLPLSVGARVVLADQQTANDGRQLLNLLQTCQATIMQGTPATFRLLLQAGWQGERQLVAWCGGEALPSELARALLERAKQVWNVYGPTETTVWSTSFLISDPDVIRLGRPLANTQAYVLDANDQPVPVGVLGELYLGGAGVSAGYLRRPELTEQRFVANPYHDPFADYANSRLYRTGDLVRWRHDGNLEYVGRNDQQIKLRGYRIELGEIETMLSDHPGVRQAVAAVRMDRPNDPRLVAYVVPAAQPATATELRKHLRQRLPEYMVPQHFVDLEELPLTNNGKVDRGRLPPPFTVQAHVVHVPEQALSPVHKYVLRICKDVLRVPALSIGDNFFQVGGHSLLAFEVLARIEKETGARLPPSVLMLDTLEQVADGLPPDRVPQN